MGNGNFTQATEHTDSQPLRRFAEVARRIAAACERGGREPGTVSVMAVTKYASPAAVADLINNGLISCIGENKAQDAVKRWAGPPLAQYRNLVKRHFIGHLQSNKAGRAVEFADSIDSIDSLHLAQAVARKAQEAGLVMPVLMQVKLTALGTQGGLNEREARALAETAAKLPGLKVNGYMAIAPVAENPEALRPYFRHMKQIFDADFPAGGVLSLGMSGDFEVAVEEGSTLPRIGSAIFD
ncbi:MAG: YggS family pyridoxal phosphate-dependent enzyme [Elusimicrobiaceae bacterium]|nr:YggS family pyridoxal phosphate-dependent enzyme [Elusimicrobiaceae bacterium]